jgi:hypothetical protein
VLPFFHQAPVLRDGVLLDGDGCADGFSVAWLLLQLDSQSFLLGEAKMSGMSSTDDMACLLYFVAVEALTLKTLNLSTKDFTVIQTWSISLIFSEFVQILDIWTGH